MRPVLKAALFPLAAAVAALAVPASSAPANAAEAVAVPAAHMVVTQPTDISARRKKRYYSYRYYRHGYGPHWYGARYAWHYGDPNSLYNYYRRNNICAIDEGYGRATRCD